MVRDKWASGSATIQWLQHGCLDLQEAQFIQVTPHGGNGTTARDEDVPGLIPIGNQVKVPLALANLSVFQPMILLRERTQSLGENTIRQHMQGALSSTCDKEKTSDLDKIAQI